MNYYNQQNMMKRLALCFFALIASMPTWSVPVTKEEALQNALQFLSGSNHRNMPVNSSSLTLAYTKNMSTAQNQQLPCYYVFNIGSDGGYVIVSGDDRTASVLGYSTSGAFSSDNMPDNMRAWLDGYQIQMEWLANHQMSEINDIIAQQTQQSRQPISPMLVTKWYQDEPYNGMCPDYYGITCHTGCVATAMAQVLNYHRYPARMLKDIPAYTSNSSIYVETIPAIDIDWDNILPTYDGSETQAQKDAVAYLMFISGASIFMNYGTGSSDAHSEYIPSALRNYFGYDGAVSFENRNDYSYEEWVDIIYSELENNRPVLYGGMSSTGGHEFVVDGYSSDDFFHINWGWNGNNDDYFLLSILNRNTNSDIDAIEGFSFYQDAVIGIQPDKGGTNASVMTTVSIYTENTTYSRASESDNFNNVTVSCGIFNRTGETTSFDIGLGVFNSDGILVSTQVASSNTALDMWQGWNSRQLSCCFGADLPDDVYYLAPVSRISGTTQWHANKGYRNYHVTAIKEGNSLTVTGPNPQLIATMEIVGSAEMGKPVRLKAKVTNTGTDINDDLILYDSFTRIGGRHIELVAGDSTTMEFSFIPNGTGNKSIRLTYNNTTIANTLIYVEPAKAYSISAEAFVTNAAGWNTIKGTTMKVSANLTNNSPYAYDDVVSLKLLEYNETTGGTAVVDEITKQLVIAAGETVQVDFQFDDLQVGSKYLCVVFYRSSMQNVLAISTMIYTIEPYDKPMLSVESLDIAGDLIQGSEQQLNLTLKNNGAEFVGTVYYHYQAGSEGEIITNSCQETIALGREKHLTLPVTFIFDGTLRVWVTSSLDMGQELSSTTVTISPAATLTANSYTREYGLENPEFDFTADKGGYRGTPIVTCEATAESPAGTYPIVITQGSVNNEYVTLVNGTLTINKAMLTVTANDQTMEEGQELPLFTVSYNGFRLQDDESVLTKQPIVTTTATAQSEPGQYPIIASGAEALNYDFNYINGVLTVEEASGIHGIQDSDIVVRRQPDGKITVSGLNAGEAVSIYSINGLLEYRLQANAAEEAEIDLAHYPKGIYVIKIGSRKTIKIQKQ